MPTRFDAEDSLARDASVELTTIASDHTAVCDQLLQGYRNQTIAPETGNKAMFRLNTALIRNGVDRIEREATRAHPAKAALLRGLSTSSFSVI